MITKGVRLYGKKDLRLEEYELPEIKEDEILASVVTDSICMSTWKLLQQGENHKKAPKDLSKNPVLIGHEFCGDIIEVGKKWKNKYKEGEKYVVQANLQLPSRPDCPGYSYKYTGGDAQYIILSKDVMNQDCLLSYKGETYFEGSLVEPLSTLIGAFNANYRIIPGTYEHEMGIKEQGNLLIMGGTGPMGMLGIDYALHGPRNPKNIVVTGIDENKLDYIRKRYKSTDRTKLHLVNVKDSRDQVEQLKEVINGEKYDDIFVMLANKDLVRDASMLLAVNSCLNFFAGPQDKDFMSEINMYDMHYNSTHYVGTSGGNTDDMKEAVNLIEEKKVNVANVITHVLGLNDVIKATENLPEIGGGKKMVYTHKNIKLFDLKSIEKDTELYSILNKTEGVWSKEAEDYILSEAENI